MSRAFLCVSAETLTFEERRCIHIFLAIAGGNKNDLVERRGDGRLRSSESINLRVACERERNMFPCTSKIESFFECKTRTIFVPRPPVCTVGSRFSYSL